jgi:predicted dinucleotide-binding enzyme
LRNKQEGFFVTTITMIGTGRMCSALGRVWARAGHSIIFGSRDPAGRADVIAGIPGARVVGIDEALAAAEVVVIGTPFTAVAPFAQAYAGQLRGRLVIDITNPFDNLPDNRVSGAELTAQAIGQGARVMAAFKANFWESFETPRSSEGIVRDVHFVGGDEADKALLSRLITDIGFQPVDCGDLKNARVLDVMVPLLLELDRRYGANRHSSWKFLGT